VGGATTPVHRLANIPTPAILQTLNSKGDMSMDSFILGWALILGVIFIPAYIFKKLDEMKREN
jgi:hypothetical protein